MSAKHDPARDWSVRVPTYSSGKPVELLAPEVKGFPELRVIASFYGDSAERNARLAAAAPDMLAALERLAIVWPCPDGNDFELVKAALAKREERCSE